MKSYLNISGNQKFVMKYKVRVRNIAFTPCYIDDGFDRATCQPFNSSMNVKYAEKGKTNGKLR
jgi:hypothetical protein